MADSLQIVSTSLSGTNFELRPDIQDRGLIFKIWNPDDANGYYSIPSQETVRFMVAPSGCLMISDASGILSTSDNLQNDKDLGYYYTDVSNLGTDIISVLPKLCIPDVTDWENTKFNLFWSKYNPAFNQYIASGNLYGVYSYPHKITQSEINLAASITDLLGNGTLSLGIRYSNIKNDDSTDYITSPYGIAVATKPYAYEFDSGAYVAGWEPYSGYYSGAPEAGIQVNLPYYYIDNVPATYWVTIANDWAGWGINNSILTSGQFHEAYDYTFKVDAGLLGSGSLNFNKEAQGFTVDNLRKVDDDQFINRDIIDRRRASIGIKDISLLKNVYSKKTGVYISPLYPLDFTMYTFSLKVEEYIPEYKNIDKYTTVKYYVQFNNQEWLRISPINRPDEYEGDKLISKMIVFDQAADSEKLKFMNVNFLPSAVPVNIFAVKIVFDFTMVTDADFVPAEIKNYTAVIFDQNQLLSESLS